MAAFTKPQVDALRRGIELLAFVQDTSPGYLTGWVHADICQRLERFSKAVTRGQSPRLIITMPPRHGKSHIVSERFPAWHLGRNPEHHVIVASYAADLANKFSKRARALVEHQATRETFPQFRLDPDAQAVQDWGTTAGGGFRAAGVGGGITGMGAHVLVIDDPIKDAEEAHSPTIREKVWEWYTSTAYTRLLPGAGVLVIMTRWHGDDLVGRLLKQGGWEVAHYPAIADEEEEHRAAGDALHPERYDLAQLQSIREAIGSYYFSALYQGRPTAREGQPFTSLQYHEGRGHEGLRLFCAVDMAYAKGPHNDYTAVVIGGTDTANNLYELHYHEARMDAAERVAYLMELMRLWKPRGLDCLHIEAHKDFTEHTLPLAQNQTGFRFRVEALATAGRPKELRILDLQPAVKSIYFAPGSKLAQRLMAWSPTNGAPDDGPDALAYLRQVADRAYATRPVVDMTAYSAAAKKAHELITKRNRPDAGWQVAK